MNSTVVDESLSTTATRVLFQREPTYVLPDKSCFQEPKELKTLVTTGRLVQKFLPKQADIDKILKIIQ